ncbi:helix-turn-helix domain-containing protein [Streptomyces sp. NPDC058289]|uniref:helix-turn-helix domain-containing protein n=1 Tax=Streptomyces sp. NPDC058289 TaxID=3346425 RepID=UPI0036E6C26D
MTQEEWPARLARTMAAEVRRFRQVRGMSAQQLADRCAELGMPIARSVLANFESGRRPTLSVAELLIIAQALRVPPVSLVFPVGYEERTEYLPGKKYDTFEAAQWFSGEVPGHGLSSSWQATEDDVAAFRETPFGVAQFREHERLVRSLVSHQLRADAKMKRAVQLGENFDPELHRALLQVAEEMTEATYRTAEEVAKIRAELREDGLTPPPLPYYLAPYFEEDIAPPPTAEEILARTDD